jgi:hypothetical protein
LTPGFPDLGWEKIRIQNEHRPSYFRKLRNNFLGLKILQFFDADPGSGMEKFGSGIKVPDPHYWSQ